ncbi:hypothetical protein [Pseudotenacibaculum haliotis]|uniref:Lipoprotein n=1 Tax=Pseudotenacibaculum haliotis TaxID=1862138 RepID=A0ABW5LQA8_9FLAO
MKKVFPLLAVFSLLLVACPPIPHHFAYKKIEYNAYTRGSSEYISLDRSVIKYVQNNQDTIRKPIRNKHNKHLYELLKNINLETLSGLKVPSKKHQYDGAMAATLSVYSFGDYKNTSPTFDDNNPPEELKELIDYIKGLVKK